MEVNPMKWLENKVVFITGAGEGIGKAVVNRFLDEGPAGIIAFDLVEERLAIVCGDVRSLTDN